ncbi:hypothetical protein I0D00_10940 [Pseudomonas lalucatii]|uniref:Uncharacterized protein n=1 Tax=Pseudomonas lalucatii TaxID=1424203 RepID=A0ABS5Q288_9PSED|nr:hypothetical protein [Pseudomonas lalucatii]MBS7662446.1 hypothetical protein [Pseudomonas lalucatii]MBS7725909.1 hypothetical protein [Pseudomonas lalucatii]QVM88499.1 hypothetical protein I0D68_08110 [Pseudomonas lalucatii]
MSELKDRPIDQGTRKRAEYDNARRARLALNIERSDGRMLQIPVESDMRSHEEEPEIQQNTFLAVVPMARLPGYDQYDIAPKGALPRPGRIYVFQSGKLWRELACDGQGNLSDVDVAHWRKLATQGRPADDRAAVGRPLALTLVPMLLQGRFVGDQYSMAYSEMAWTWEYIAWLEASSGRVQNRCQNVAPAWSAAVVGGEQWRPTQAMPIVVIDKQVEGLRPRDLHIECALRDPATFTPAMTALDPQELFVVLHKQQQALARHMGAAAPAAPPGLPAGKDVLAEKSLRGYPKLVGFMLDDPLFELRHAVEQSRLATEALQTYNALVPLQPFGRYAEVLHQWSMPNNAPLADLRKHIDMAALEKTMLHTERQGARECIHRQLERTLALSQRKLTAVWNDWVYSNDERLLEPYSLLIDMLEMLSRLPQGSDARSTDAEDRALAQAVERLIRQLADANHPLTRAALADQNGTLPELAKRLAKLAATNRAIKPENLGISSLAMFAGLESQQSANYQYAAQNLALAVDEWLNHLSKAVLLTLRQLRTNAATVQLDMQRLFTPTAGLLSKLHSQAKTIKFMPQGEALAQNMVVLGVHGGGLSFGLAPSERTTLTRQNYLYGNLQGRGGNVLATTSGKLAEANRFASKDLGRFMVVAAPANDPLVQELNSWRLGAANLGRAGQIAKSPALPLFATLMAAYNLHVNTVGAKALIEHETGRWVAGFISAFTDLFLASNNVALKIIEGSSVRSPWYALWEKGRFDVSRISQRWASNLSKRTGSTWLNASRAGSFVAMGVTSVLFAWDAKRAFDQGDKDVSVANAIAASGGAMWALYTVGLLASPWVLGAGIVLLLGGAVAAVLLADGAIEQAIKHGPFGKEQRLAHMSDPRVAYQQLLGAIGQPRVRIERLENWQKSASAEDQAKLQAAEAQGNSDLDPLDWVVELQSGLLSQYPSNQGFTLLASELELTRSYHSGWQRRPAKVISREKLGAVVLDGSRVLYVLPYQHQPGFSPLAASQYALKVRAQFRLEHQACRAGDPFPAYDDLILPQPSPRQWAAFNPALLPEEDDVMDDVPYWLIDQSDYRKL